MRRALIPVVVLAACYSAPNYDGTNFKCDGTHACPAGQSCVDGTCGGSGSGSVGSGTPVVCMGVTCASGSGCCYDPVGGNHCAAPGMCDGEFGGCTSTANCGSDQRCCDAASPTCGSATCSGVVCTTSSDCPTNTPVCCSFAPLPWGECNVAC